MLAHQIALLYRLHGCLCILFPCKSLINSTVKHSHTAQPHTRIHRSQNTHIVLTFVLLSSYLLITFVCLPHSFHPHSFQRQIPSPHRQFQTGLPQTRAAKLPQLFIQNHVVVTRPALANEAKCGGFGQKPQGSASLPRSKCRLYGGGDANGGSQRGACGLGGNPPLSPPARPRRYLRHPYCQRSALPAPCQDQWRKGRARGSGKWKRKKSRWEGLNA